MKVTIESTNTITEIDGKRCRLWEGKTAAGTRLWMFVALISISAEDDAAELDTELIELFRQRGAFRNFDEIHDGTKP